MFVVYVAGRGFVECRGGAWYFHESPELTSKYPNKDSAESGKVGRHRGMGGSGFKGRIVTYRP